MVYILGALFGVMVLRYAWLQLVQGDSLAQRMREQVGSDFAIQSPRGTILDRNGREMAVSVMTKSLYVDPTQSKTPKSWQPICHRSSICRNRRSSTTSMSAAVSSGSSAAWSMTNTSRSAR